jgi:hypothetical protein
MRYRDLVQFEPIETVIQLRDADKQDAAQHLVETYVISDRMAEQLTELVIPQLQFLSPHDNKGVLVVGNYGTGKSHLMSVISALAQYPEAIQALKHTGVKKNAKAISGKFKVRRVEIGSVKTDLREILLGELEDALDSWGTPYKFPPANKIPNNKNAIIEAVGKFQEKYPEQGILLVVDELLDYLRTRHQQDLILDLGFLRELGEVAALTPFRFLGGLQETLFDNPRFAFVADQLRRVRDRFEQVRIAREDIAFVVSHRLLNKTDAQRAQITKHLRPFTPFYKQMAERFDEFVSLFPIHPAYIETFERVYIAEKREVLKTFSHAMRGLLDQDVPADQPGLISYDDYWQDITENPSLRSIEDVAQVIEKSNVLEGRIRNAYTRPNLLPMATRIIHALSVQRLTTYDIHARLGVTAEELRDGLCLYTQIPEKTAEFLRDQVQVALREIMKTVQGQFLSYGEENGQYYLDLKKVVDFDAKISERGETMSKDELNRFFFDALRQTMNLSDTTYVSSYPIWFYELPWMEHKITRPGYLFFGAPDERSTAQPPRDFYIYVIPPFNERKYHDEKRSDEVIFELASLDEDFEHTVCLYAGARAMANEATEHRQEYADKANDALRTLVRWLNEHLNEHLRVTYQGVTEPIGKVMADMRSTASQNIEDLLRVISAHLLTPDFTEHYPEYPTFSRLSQPISDKARENSAMDAVRILAGRARTNLGLGILEGLELLDGQDEIRPYASRYANKYLGLLNAKAENQVVNRGEIIETIAGGLVPIEKDIFFRLEPEWIVVILLALVFNGDIVLNVDGREELDAASIEKAATRALSDLVNFRFFKRPRDLPVNLWVMIFEGLGLQPGVIRDQNTREQAVRDHLQPKITSVLNGLVDFQHRLQNGLQLWNQPVFTDRTTMVVEAGTVVASDMPEVVLSINDLLPGLRGYKQFLEDMAKINTVGKLRNLRMTPSEIKDAFTDQERVEQARQLLELVGQLQPITSYLAEGMANFQREEPWYQRAEALRVRLLDEVRRFGRGENAKSAADLRHDLETLKKEYITAYADHHHRRVLDIQGDERRKRLYDDPRLAALKELSGVDLLRASGGTELTVWQQTISGIQTCRDFHEGILAESPTCRCGFRPANSADIQQANQVLERLDSTLDDLVTRWRQALRDALSSKAAQASLEAMTAVERKPVETFLSQKDDTTDIPKGFVQAATQALRGIQAMTLPVDAMLEALKTGGLPCTPEELQRRFTEFIQKQMRGHDTGTTRLTLDR